MGVKNEHMAYTRKADLKIQQLREVIGKIQRGEEVDVEKALGTGDEKQEKEWEEAFEELRQQDRVWQNNKDKVKLGTEGNASSGGEHAKKMSALDTTSTTNTTIRSTSPGFY
jgi:GTP cyclohydrolase III